jgi:hypothetical protein
MTYLINKNDMFLKSMLEIKFTVSTCKLVFFGKLSSFIAPVTL